MDWFSDTYPHMLCIPMIPKFDGICLQQLNVNPLMLPLEQAGSIWKLHQGLMESWMHLENALYFITKILLKQTDVNLPLNLSFLPLPHTFGYTRQFHSARKAKGAALHSRDTFGALIGLVSFVILMFPEQSVTVPGIHDNNIMSLPPWVRYLRDQYGIHSAWMEDL
ncbi:hypothetical protein M422DRAFT_179942, partial [Sphaerobolus stellatus SS14]